MKCFLKKKKKSHCASLRIDLGQGFSLPTPVRPPPHLFVNKALLEHGHAHSFPYYPRLHCTRTAAWMSKDRNCTARTAPKTVLWLLQKKPANPRSGRSPVLPALPSSVFSETRRGQFHIASVTVDHGGWGTTQPLPGHTCSPGCLLEGPQLWGLDSSAGPAHVALLPGEFVPWYSARRAFLPEEKMKTSKT